MNNDHPRTSRRSLLAATTLLAASTLAPGHAAEPASAPPKAVAPPEDYKVKNGRIRHSAMGAVMGIPGDILIPAARKMGMPAVEAVGDIKKMTWARELGLAIGYVGAHGFTKGPLDPANHAECEAKLRAGIDNAVKLECSNVITFTGYRVKGISDEQSVANCIELWKKVMPYAEEKKVNLVLEMLNTRDDTHPMKGHPGYFGNDIELCADLCKKVGSPRMKLLFDLYHIQIMNGDVIRRIRQHKDLIAHVHVAGVPGRGELDDTQEVNWPTVMRALLEIGYTGFVAQEFIPTWPDKLAALRHAVNVCDV